VLPALEPVSWQRDSWEGFEELKHKVDGNLDMKLRVGLFGLALTSLGAIAPANSADIYRGGPAVGGYKDVPYMGVDWSGFYVGANGGGGWSGNNQLQDPTIFFGGVRPEGGFGGGQIGYNWSGIWFPRLVLGFETDIEGSGISDKRHDILGDTFKSNLNYFGTVRGRAGYAWDSALLYFTGGFAYGGLHKHTDDFFPADFRLDRTATGYVLGGGVEYKFTPIWSVKVEYQYLNFGKNDPVDVSGLGLGRLSFNTGVLKDDDYHTVRVGVNYYFVPVYAPLK
jgi:outer membrane immunogenic protein